MRADRAAGGPSLFPGGWLSRALWRGRAVDAVLFDLDGTLMDTLPDITLSLNRALAELRLQPLTLAEVRPLIGRGGPVLIERAVRRLGVTMDARALASLHERFALLGLSLLEANESTAALFPGVLDGLLALRALGLKIAVVTNKQQRLALDLISRQGLRSCVDAVVGGDECARRKPDPEPLRLACGRLEVPTGRALMVGDSINDVLAARAAEMPVICVPYGYNEGQDARLLPCDALIESIGELPALLGGTPAQLPSSD